jgi:hypothetical protein
MTKQLARKFNQVLGGLFVSSSLLAGGLWPLEAMATEFSRFNGEQGERSSVSGAQTPLPEGVYLYGETQAPEQIGATYMVLEVDNDQVVGAFYMPHSSFDCFQGGFAGNQLDVTVVNSYDQTAHDVSLIVEDDNYIASIGDPMTAPARLNGLHNLETVSENDQRILETCKADF